MTKEATGSSFTPELLGGVPEAFVQTALLAGGIGLWEWQVAADRMALSPYLETLLGYPSGGFDGTKADVPRAAEAHSTSRASSSLSPMRSSVATKCDTEFRVFDVHGHPLLRGEGRA